MTEYDLTKYELTWVRVDGVVTGGATKHRIGYIGCIGHIGVHIMLLLDMTQFKVVKGKRLGSVLVKQFSRARPGWGLADVSDVSDAVFRRTLVTEAPTKLLSSHSTNWFRFVQLFSCWN